MTCTCVPPYREELNKLTQHLLCRGHGPEMARATSGEGVAGISTARWREYQFWVYSAVKEVRDTMIEKCRQSVKDLPEEQIGSWMKCSPMWDARWQSAGRSSKQGSSNCCCAAAEGICTLGSVHYCMNTTEREMEELGLKKHTGSSASMDTNGAEENLRQLLEYGMIVENCLQDGDGRTSARIADVMKEVIADPNCQQAKPATQQSCVGHILVNVSNKVIKMLTGTGATVPNKTCKQHCKKRLKIDPKNKKGPKIPGVRRACHRATIGFVRGVLCKSIRTWLEKQPIPQTEEDVAAIEARFEQGMEEDVYPHCFDRDHSNCNHDESWETRKDKPGHITTCKGQMDEIVKIVNEKVGICKITTCETNHTRN